MTSLSSARVSGFPPLLWAPFKASSPGWLLGQLPQLGRQGHQCLAQPLALIPTGKLRRSWSEALGQGRSFGPTRLYSGACGWASWGRGKGAAFGQSVSAQGQKAAEIPELLLWKVLVELAGQSYTHRAEGTQTPAPRAEWLCLNQYEATGLEHRRSRQGRGDQGREEGTPCPESPNIYPVLQASSMPPPDWVFLGLPHHKMKAPGSPAAGWTQIPLAQNSVSTPVSQTPKCESSMGSGPLASPGPCPAPASLDPAFNRGQQVSGEHSPVPQTFWSSDSLARVARCLVTWGQLETWGWPSCSLMP